MGASLVGVSGQIELGTSKLNIGRAPTNQLVLADTQVSGYHAEIRPEGEGYSIVDLGSRNGTFVNDYWLTPNAPRTLNSNDHLRFGQRRDNPHIQFTYKVEGVAPIESTDPSLPLAHGPHPQQGFQQTLPSYPPYQPPQQGSPTHARQRPSIWDIVSGHAHYTVPSEISDEERAYLLAPLAGLSPGDFYAGMRMGNVLGKALGIKCTHQLQKIFPAPYQYTTIVLALVLASRHLRREILSLHDTPRGSIVQLKMAAEIWSTGGTLTIEFIDESPSRIVVNGESEIPGSMTDWGIGKRALEDLFRVAEGWYLHRLVGY